MTSPRSDEDEAPPVRVTDKRRLDPETGEPRSGAGAQAPSGETPPGGAAGAAPPGAVPAPPGFADATDEIDLELADLITESPVDEAAQQLAERTEDLRRLKAEYDNYRRRIERDRAGWGELAVAKVIGDLLPALDDIERAKAHDALDGAFRAVADQLEKATTSAGLTSFGAVGEGFDPSRHEALTTVPGDVEAEQVLEVYRAGYEFGGRVIRAAQVVVAVPVE